MKAYELLYIIPPKFTDQELKEIVAEVENIIKEAKSNILDSRLPEKRILAYPVKHCRIGFCGLIKFENDASAISKIDEKLRMMPNILRHGVFTYKETQKPSFEKETIKRKETRPIKPKERPMVPPAEDRVAEESPKSDKSEKIKLEELDKKLEEILKE